MKILALVSWVCLLSPFLLIVAKLAGWISWTWIVTVCVAVGIPISSCIAILLFAVWIIQKEFSDEWNHQ